MLLTLLPEINSIPPLVINIALICLSAGLAVLSTVLFKSRESAAAREKRLTTLETQLAVVSAAVVPISTAFQAILIKELTHFHTPEMDALLAKVGPPNVLTPVEQDRLGVLLKERTKDLGEAISQSEREAAAILPIVMKRAAVEQATMSVAANLASMPVLVATVPTVPTCAAAT